MIKAIPDGAGTNLSRECGLTVDSFPHLCKCLKFRYRENSTFQARLFRSADRLVIGCIKAGQEWLKVVRSPVNSGFAAYAAKPGQLSRRYVRPCR